MNPILEQLNEAVAARDFDSVENLWLDLLEAESIPSEELGRLLARMVNAGEGRRTLDLAMAIVPDLLRAGRFAETLPLLRAVVPAASGNDEVRAALLDAYRHVHADKPHLAACIDASGLLTTSDLAEALACLDKFLSRRKGDYFYHAAGWGVGRIVDFDPLATTATIDFQGKHGHRVPLETIDQIFVALEPDDFRVLCLTDPDRLRRLASDDPAALARMAIRASDGHITLRGLKNALVDRIVPADAWSKWWSGARTQLKRDPHVGISGGAHAVLSLRAEALTHEDEMRARFDALKDLRLQVELLREYGAHMDPQADREAFLLPAARAVAESLRSEPEPATAFEAALLLDRLGAAKGDLLSPEEVVAAQPDPVALLNRLWTNEARRRAFAILQCTSPHWAECCRETLLRGPRELWEPAFAGLPESGDPPTAASFVGEVMSDPKANPTLFAWVCRGLLLGRWPVKTDPKDVFEQLLTEGDELARRKAQRRVKDGPFEAEEILAAIRQSLRAGDLRYFDRILDAASETEAARLLFRIRQSSALSDQLGRIVEQRIFRRFPRLLAEEEAEAKGPEYIYSTPEALARRQKDHEHLVNVRIPENAAAIGRAAEQGDISDNADWRSAIEERDRLGKLAAQMADELQRARPIVPSMVNTDVASIGSRVTVEDTRTGKRATYTLLGPWDADSERGIIAYIAPLAQILLRHRVGAEVTLEHVGERATYRILAIENGLEEGS